MKKDKIALIIEIIGIIILTTVAFLFKLTDSELSSYSYLLIFLLIYLLFKPVLAKWYKPFKSELQKNLSISIIIPYYNEDLSVFKACLTALETQSFSINKVVLIDDNSKDLSCYQFAEELAAKSNLFISKRVEKNSGKRELQEIAFKEIDDDFIGLLDSDTILNQNAIEEGLKPFSDSKINAVCCNISAYNKNDNLLTRLIDMLYMNAFQINRSSQSFLDSVLCCTGMFSIYRSEIIRANMDDYVNESFFGIKIKCGDDRRMSSYALRDGKTVIQSTCKAQTVAPSSIKNFILQQFRWNRSFFREASVVFFTHSPKRMYWYLNALELAFWVLSMTAVLYGLIFDPMRLLRFMNIYFFGYLIIITYTRNYTYVKGNFLIFLISPFFSLMHFFILLPLRVVALFSITNSKWYTR